MSFVVIKRGFGEGPVRHSRSKVTVHLPHAHELLECVAEILAPRANFQEMVTMDRTGTLFTTAGYR